MDYHNLALFSDLDGTLLDSQRQVSRENRQALEHFIAGGGLFGISTGRAPLNALALLPGVPINTWSVVLNGAEAYRYQTGTVAFPRVLPQLRAAALVQWVLERLPRTQVLLCSESRLFFLSPRDLADPDFLLSHQPCTFTNLGAALDYPWLKILFAAPRPDLEHLEQWATDYGILEVMDRVYTSPTYLEFLPGRSQGPLPPGSALSGRPKKPAHDCRGRLYQRSGASPGSRRLHRRGQCLARGPGRCRIPHPLPQPKRHRPHHPRNPARYLIGWTPQTRPTAFKRIGSGRAHAFGIPRRFSIRYAKSAGKLKCACKFCSSAVEYRKLYTRLLWQRSRNAAYSSKKSLLPAQYRLWYKMIQKEK